MADIADQAADYTEHQLSISLKNSQKNLKEKRLPAKGSCWWCAEPFDAGSKKVFCDIECSEDYEKHKRQKMPR